MVSAKVPSKVARHVRQQVGAILRRTNHLLNPPPTIWGRVACLGRNVFSLSPHSRDFSFLNQQKVRCDLFLEWLAGAPRPRAEALRTHVDREDVFPLLCEQEALLTRGR